MTASADSNFSSWRCCHPTSWCASPPKPSAAHSTSRSNNSSSSEPSTTVATTAGKVRWRSTRASGQPVAGTSLGVRQPRQVVLHPGQVAAGSCCPDRADPLVELLQCQPPVRVMPGQHLAGDLPLPVTHPDRPRRRRIGCCLLTHPLRPAHTNSLWLSRRHSPQLTMLAGLLVSCVYLSCETGPPLPAAAAHDLANSPESSAALSRPPGMPPTAASLRPAYTIGTSWAHIGRRTLQCVPHWPERRGRR